MANVADISTVERDTLQTMVTNRLRKLILTQKIKPGERLVQDELAQQLGVSRTPVREAIRQLEAENLVTILPYKGAAVSQVSPEELEGIYHVRLALEMHASHLAFQNCQALNIKVLRSFVNDMQKAFEQKDPEAIVENNHAFYKYFYSLAKQPELSNLIMTYIDKSKRFRQQHFYDKTLAKRTIDLHSELVDLLEAKGEKRFLEHMQQGLQTVATELIESLNQELR